MVPLTVRAWVQVATSGDSGSGWATGIIVAVAVILILIPGVIVGRRALVKAGEKSPEELAKLNPRLTFRGPWGPARIGYLVAAILLSISLWRFHGPLLAVISVASGLAVGGLFVVYERCWLRRRGWRPPGEREH